MSGRTHNTEAEGANARDYNHARHHFWRHAHRDWRVWCAVVLMLAMMVVYVMTNDLSHRPGRPPGAPTPEAIP